MAHDEPTPQPSGQSLSTQDLSDAGRPGEHRLAEVPATEEVRGAHHQPPVADTHDGRFDDTRDVDLVAEPVGGPVAEHEDDLTPAATAETRPDAAPRGDAADEPATPQLFADAEIDGFRQNWQEIQIAFVDDPKRAVSEADELVAAVIQSLATTFAAHKSELEAQWQQGEAATEDLRVALRQYRSFFNQLLST